MVVPLFTFPYPVYSLLHATLTQAEMKKILTLTLVLFTLPPALAAGRNNAGLLFEMMRSMLTLYEMMELYHEFASLRDRVPYGGPPPEWRSPPPTLPPFFHEGINELDGAWVSNNHLLLAIRDGYARIYWAKNKYRDFEIDVRPPLLRLTDIKSGQSEIFLAAMKRNRMILRDKKGRLALFNRLY